MALKRAQVVVLKARFLDEFRRRGNITATARALGVAHSTVYKWREIDKDFAGALANAAEEALDGVECEARRRAMGEVQLPVYHQGEAVGHIPRYPDRLLMFLMRAHGPEKFSERYERRAGNSNGQPELSLEELLEFLEGPKRS